MREIKFRAFFHGAGDPRVEPEMKLSGPSIPLFWKSIEDWPLGVEIMQYTGLTDKNGVEIFESDVVALNGKAMGHIEYVDGLSSFMVRTAHGTTISPIDMFEVIGNIYQNKDLLC